MSAHDHWNAHAGTPPPPSRPSPAASDDAELLALGAELERRWAAEHQLDLRDGPVSDEELTFATRYTGEIVDRITPIPARTMQGLKVKLRALAWRQSAYKRPFDVWANPTEAQDLINELLGYGVQQSRGSCPSAYSDGREVPQVAANEHLRRIIAAVIEGRAEPNEALPAVERQSA